MYLYLCDFFTDFKMGHKFIGYWHTDFSVSTCRIATTSFQEPGKQKFPQPLEKVFLISSSQIMMSYLFIFAPEKLKTTNEVNLKDVRISVVN